MARRVRIHADFRSDLRRQLRWLAENRSQAAVQALRGDIHDAAALLGRFPNAGSVDIRDGRSAIRRLILRSSPFVVWYTHDTSHRAGDVWLMRLFHARQSRR